MVRAFGPIGQGSLRGSMLSLILTWIGGGTLALPHVLAQSGWILGSFLIILGWLISIWSFY